MVIVHTSGTSNPARKLPEYFENPTSHGPTDPRPKASANEKPFARRRNQEHRSYRYQAKRSRHQRPSCKRNNASGAKARRDMSPV
ncbi:MAG TPA: hypothetical protein VOA41_03510 [Candidatus Dormibacteraeota bacterium]|nr:hypothetical protein [Candidatus Dormibacteraeota bacterium]